MRKEIGACERNLNEVANLGYLSVEAADGGVCCLRGEGLEG